DAFPAIEVETLHGIIQQMQAALENSAFQSTVAEISIFHAYKSLHDQLHQLRLQLEPAQTLVQSNFSEKTAPRELRQLLVLLGVTLHAVREPGDRLPAGQTAWTKDIAAARDRISEGLLSADATAQAIIRDAIGEIARVLDIESQRINSIMVNGYANMSDT